MNQVDEIYDFFLFLGDMFDTQYILGTPDQIVVRSAKKEFWDTVVVPRLPEWAKKHTSKAHVPETYIIDLSDVPFRQQICAAAMLAKRRRKRL